MRGASSGRPLRVTRPSGVCRGSKGEARFRLNSAGIGARVDENPPASSFSTNFSVSKATLTVPIPNTSPRIRRIAREREGPARTAFRPSAVYLPQTPVCLALNEAIDAIAPTRPRAKGDDDGLGRRLRQPTLYPRRRAIPAALGGRGGGVSARNGGAGGIGPRLRRWGTPAARSVPAGRRAEGPARIRSRRLLDDVRQIDVVASRARSARRGWAVALPSYTLAPAARICEIAREVGPRDRVRREPRRRRPAAGGAFGRRSPGDAHDQRGHAIAGGGRWRGSSRSCPISGLHDLRPLLATRMNGTLRMDDAEAVAESAALRRPVAGARVVCWVGSASGRSSSAKPICSPISGSGWAPRRGRVHAARKTPFRRHRGSRRSGFGTHAPMRAVSRAALTPWRGSLPSGKTQKLDRGGTSGRPPKPRARYR